MQPRTFKVKGAEGLETTIEVIGTRSDGYDIVIRSESHFGVRESTDFISYDLLESCLRTGYLIEHATYSHVS